MRKKLKDGIFILFPLFVGLLAGFISRSGMNVYDSVKTSPLSPPGWLFPIVWTVLYLLMGIGAYIVTVKSKEKNIDDKSALSCYFLQLFFNFVWSIVFFNFRGYFTALLVIAVLWVLIIKMILEFNKISPLAAYLQIPYLLWVTFAAYLNLSILILNR